MVGGNVEGNAFRSQNMIKLRSTRITKKKPTIDWTGALVIFLLAFVGQACGRPEILSGFGIGGKYLQGKEEITRRRGGDVDQAIVSLEAVVLDNPTYKDSLTLLGRAYYKKQRFHDAYQVLQRALTVNADDEIAWLVFGITQFRLSDDQKGLQTLQGGLSLFGKVSESGYKGFRYWDRAGRVKAATRAAVFIVSKGLEGKKEDISRSVENLLATVDLEEWNLTQESDIDFRREMGTR
jgi:tetratricopeptide (TPR) repeat protein